MAALVAETLAKRHRVTVLAGRPSYDPEERYSIELLRRDVRNDVAVERVGSTAYPRHQMRRRVANYLSYLALAVPRALAIRADLILAMTDPPVAGIAGALVAHLSRRPFVYNIRDLYPDMALGGDIVRPSRWVQQWESLHRRALRQAARIIVLGEDMRERILSKGIEPDRVVVVRDGAVIPESLPARDHPIARELRQPRFLWSLGNAREGRTDARW
jgi:colanic acid biosynthesis glycosyl transferase WcaI